MAKYKQQLCPRGHNKDIVGRRANGACKECIRENERGRYIPCPPKTSVCKMVMKKRKPQPVCKCSHAKTSHWNLGTSKPCMYGDSLCLGVFHICTDYKMDNLKTLERIYEHTKK